LIMRITCNLSPTCATLKAKPILTKSVRIRQGADKMFEQVKLGYDFAALEPHIDQLTMENPLRQASPPGIPIT